MSSRSFAIAYACDRLNEMSKEELHVRIANAAKYVESLHRAELTMVHVGDGRTGFVVWYPTNTGSGWPAAISTQHEAAAWIHIPAAAKGPDAGVDPIRLAREVTLGTVDRIELGAPAAAIHWSDSGGLRLSNDRLGMVRLYQFDFPNFGSVWSTRGGLAHIFCGQEPTIRQSTWSEIAVLGWNMSGNAHLGNGHQLGASTTVHATRQGRTTVTSDIEDWIVTTANGTVPSDERAAQGMVEAMKVVGWWKKQPAADLSGGKDSRVTAAAAIRAGVVDTVRTINTDIGEVETAQQLLDIANNPVAHRVVETKPANGTSGEALDRYLASQRAWEGAYNAISAHRGARFQGFLPLSAPSVNGLGGEAIQGRTMATAASRQKLISEDAKAGREWLNRLVTANMTSLEDGHTDVARSVIDSFGNWAQNLGFTTAFQVIDLFYHFSKMPFWSQPQSNAGVLLPYYSPNLLPRTMWSLRNPSPEYGLTHRRLLDHLRPEWSSVPFYKGSPKTRSIPWMWENPDWEDFRGYVADGVSALDSFSSKKIHQIIQQAENGEGVARHEIGLARVMWELSFREFAEEIGIAAHRTAVEVQRLET